MDFYQINDLERLSGIKAHTIRIWEKRYGLITPYRSETNIRYYDDEQLKKLLNVVTLVTSGLKISKIAQLNDQELKAQVKNTSNAATDRGQYIYYINGFIEAMLDFKELAFNCLFEEIVFKYGVQQSVTEIVYPFLHHTGLLWSINETMPVEEHFASTIIKKKLFALIDGLPAPDSNAKTFLLFLPADEWHELGLLFAEYMIRYNRCNVISLGQNVPLADLKYVIQKTKPDFLLTFLTSEDNEVQMKDLQSFLASDHKTTTCLISGAAQRINAYRQLEQFIVLDAPNDILKFF